MFCSGPKWLIYQECSFIQRSIYVEYTVVYWISKFVETAIFLRLNSPSDSSVIGIYVHGLCQPYIESYWTLYIRVAQTTQGRFCRRKFRTFVQENQAKKVFYKASMIFQHIAPCSLLTEVFVNYV